MSSKAVGSARDHLAEISIDAVKQIAEQRGDKTIADIDNIQLIKKTGKSLLETQLIRGIIIDKEIVNPNMPKKKENAKIALLDSALEIEKTEISAEIRIKDPSQMKAFLDQETDMMQDMVTKIKASGADVIFCQKGIVITSYSIHYTKLYEYIGWPRYAYRRRRDIASLLLRTALILLIVFAISGLQLVRAVDRQAVIFLETPRPSYFRDARMG